MTIIADAQSRAERGDADEADFAVLKFVAECEAELARICKQEDSQKIVTAPWWMHALGWGAVIALIIGPFAVSAFALHTPAHETPEDRGAPICVCDTQGRAICHFPEDGVQQILPREMCAGKNPGDDPMVSK